MPATKPRSTELSKSVDASKTKSEEEEDTSEIRNGCVKNRMSCIILVCTAVWLTLLHPASHQAFTDFMASC